VKSPNLELKQGISYLEREGEGGDRQIEREIDRESKTQRERRRGLIIKITSNAMLPN
jgi:hypothetical protein